MNKLKTLADMLQESVKKYQDRAAFKIKKEGEFVPVTYQELYHKIMEFGTGLLQIGINQFNHVGLVSENRLEWIVSDLAIISLRAADVPCSENSSSQDIYFKLHHSDAGAVILEGEKQFINFCHVKEKLPEIKNVILMEKIEVFSEKEKAPEWVIPVPYQENNQISEKFEKLIHNFIKHKNKIFLLSPDVKTFLVKYLENNGTQLLKKLNSNKTVDSIKQDLFQRIIIINKEYDSTQSFNIYSFQEISTIGRQLLEQGDTQFNELSNITCEDDLATIIYTSGTTADPKGVMLTHANFMHNIRVLPPAQQINQNDRFLSILPSWHIFERTAEYLALATGASTAYSKPFKQILIPDLADEKPTIMASVPRIWESVYQGAITKIKKVVRFKERFLIGLLRSVKGIKKQRDF